MKRKNKIWAVVFLLLILGMVCFIFLQSVDSREASSQKSGIALRLLKPLLDLLVGPEKATEHLVRKMAHFCEFGLLGILVAHYDRQLKNRHPARNGFFVLLIALCDETVQIFSGRGSQVQDVWLDFCGALVGLFGITVLFWLFSTLFRKRKGKK